MIRYSMPLAGIKVSTNKIYAGIHWTKRRKFKDSIAGRTSAFCQPVQSVGSYPVSIRYRFVFITRPFDTLNCAFVAKAVEDEFRAVGVIKNDTPQYVAETILEVVKYSRPKRKKKPSLLGPETHAPNDDYLTITIQPYVSQN